MFMKDASDASIVIDHHITDTLLTSQGLEFDRVYFTSEIHSVIIVNLISIS